MAENTDREENPHNRERLFNYYPTVVPGDPTPLTIDLMRRELASLQKLLEARLDATDRTAAQFREDLTRVPTTLQTSLSALLVLFEEKTKSLEKVVFEKFEGVDQQFDGVQKQFDERDIRAKAAEISAQTGLSVALSASEKATIALNESNNTAMNKSETSFERRIQATETLISANTRAIDDKIAAINARLDRGEGTMMGTRTNQSDRRLDLGSIVGVLGLIGAVFAIMFSMFRHP